ncbi:bifunctional acetate--CoA ligase family protein/GNAT family N-acetyltransferase [Cellulomonas composti]|uniref:GNAT family N-acetyltransferase n=1 Tax=Cellulomonas composti TaxID=266130 RepID=A0A511J702_9CELL|nr:GNAT family N-acetyltransferase [Cellulomonas composti]GEL93786.1 GNAT family N-acetyltransferase [Cellulomonas composti]
MVDHAVDAPGGHRPERDYPAWWEADVVLQDGMTTRVRPIRPSDADALQAFHVAQSERSTYLRFFAHLERLSDRDLARLVTVDHQDRVALVATVQDDEGVERIIGVARFDRVGGDEAEVAFNVADAHQGRGVGSVLLEHLAAAARERGVRRFVAEVLPQNGRMIAVFRDAGYAVRQHAEDGVVALSFDIDPTDRSLAVMADRERRSEARSVRALLHASSVLVVGPHHGPDRNGHGPDEEHVRPLHDGLARAVLAHLTRAPGAPRVQAVGVEPDAPAGQVHRVALDDVSGPVDLAVVALPPQDAPALVRRLAALGVHGVVVLSSGFAEAGDEGRERQRRLLAAAHGAGMRVVGPSSFGLLARRPDGLLDATLADEPPVAGSVGLFCQSGPLGAALLSAVRRRGLGLSSFVSAGHRADVSGNDLMQYWDDDATTTVAGLYLESIGNPRKFSRVARRLALSTPVVVVTAGRSGQVVPPGHAVRPTHAPPRTLAELMRQSGVIQVDSTHQLLDVVQVLAHQPLPAGRRVAIVASQSSVAALVAEACATAGLVVAGARVLPEDAAPEEVRSRLRDALTGPDADVAVIVRIPTLGGVDTEVARVLAHEAAASGRTVVACVLGLRGVTAELSAPDADGRVRTVPAYSTPEDAAVALGHAARYAAWRSSDRGALLHPVGADVRAARRLVATWLDGVPQDGVLALDSVRTVELLAAVGLRVLPAVGVRDADEAVAAARAIGWPVALKTTAPALRHRADLGGVRLDVADEAELRDDVAQVLALAAAHHPAPSGPPLEVQAMAARGSSCVVRSAEDPLFGPLVSFGLSGDASDLLGDVAYGVPPLTDVDVAELVRSARSAPRLFGYRGLPALDVEALEDVVARIAVLSDDVPEIRSLELNPVVVAERGATILSARVSLARADRADTTRRLQRT